MKDFGEIEKKNNVCINVFCYEKNLTCPVHILDQEFEVFMDLLMTKNENQSNCVYIKDFHELCAIRQGVKIKNSLEVLLTIF